MEESVRKMQIHRDESMSRGGCTVSDNIRIELNSKRIQSLRRITVANSEIATPT